MLLISAIEAFVAYAPLATDLMVLEYRLAQTFPLFLIGAPKPISLRFLILTEPSHKTG